MNVLVRQEIFDLKKKDCNGGERTSNYSQYASMLFINFSTKLCLKMFECLGLLFAHYLKLQLDKLVC